MRTIFLFFWIIALNISSTLGQACCSAGTPILSAIELSSTQADQIKFSITYEHNSINDVYNRDRQLEAIRRRATSSVLMDISYGINRFWSLSLLLSFVEQERRLNNPNSFGSLEKLITNGLGDALLIAKYNIIPNNIAEQRTLSFGLGIKVPLGESALRNNGFLLPADIQPGTGSWDGIAWLSFSQGFVPDYPGSVFGSISYRLNGENNRFQVSNSNFDSYRFGNVFNLNIGASYRVIDLLETSFQVRYRKSFADEFGNARVTNTGGEWYYFIPGITLSFDPLGFRFSGQIPLYRKLEGIQLTTSYSISASIYYIIF